MGHDDGLSISPYSRLLTISLVSKFVVVSLLPARRMTQCAFRQHCLRTFFLVSAILEDHHMKNALSPVIAVIFLVSPTFAADIKNLPKDAKLLTKAEIIAFYGSKPYRWTHPFTDKGTGTLIYVDAKSYMSGEYNFDGNKGEWEGKITWKNDQYCIQTRGKGGKKYDPIRCQDVYQVGDKLYEVIHLTIHRLFAMRCVIF
jgi:hypothetical protein